MSISANGINIPESILNLEYQLVRTQKILDFILEHNPALKAPARAALDEISTQSLQQLQAKYPSAGVILEPSVQAAKPKSRPFSP